MTSGKQGTLPNRQLEYNYFLLLLNSFLKSILRLEGIEQYQYNVRLRFSNLYNSLALSPSLII